MALRVSMPVHIPLPPAESLPSLGRVPVGPLRALARRDVIMPSDLRDLPDLGQVPTRRRVTGSYERQEKSNWCWAACYQMVLSNRGIAMPGQCALAGEVFRLQGCCFQPNRWDGPCNITIPVMGFSPAFLRRGIQSRFYPSAISFQALVGELQQDRMVLIGIKSRDNSWGHAMLIVGWDTNSEGDFLIVYDPNPARGIVADWYEDVRTAYGYGSWYATWIGIGG